MLCTGDLFLLSQHILVLEIIYPSTLLQYFITGKLGCLHPPVNAPIVVAKAVNCGICVPQVHTYMSMKDMVFGDTSKNLIWISSLILESLFTWTCFQLVILYYFILYFRILDRELCLHSYSFTVPPDHLYLFPSFAIMMHPPSLTAKTLQKKKAIWIWLHIWLLQYASFILPVSRDT